MSTPTVRQVAFTGLANLAVYACLHPLGPWAEFLRTEAPPEPLRAHFRHRMWALRLDLTDATFIDFGDAELWGIDPYDLVDDDHGACQGLADRLREQGVTTVVIPSAALPVAQVASMGRYPTRDELSGASRVTVALWPGMRWCV